MCHKIRLHNYCGKRLISYHTVAVIKIYSIMRMQSIIATAVCLLASANCSPISSFSGLKKFRQPFQIGINNAFNTDSSSSSSSLSVKKDFSDLRGGGKDAAPKSVPGFLKWAYSAVGLATTAVSSSNITYS